MKKKLFYIFITLFNSIFSYDPLLVVVLMVKDEQEVIIPTLEPFIKEKIDSYLILDTGSTDKTVEVVKKYFEENNIKNAIVLEEPFIDFSTSRNRALDLAKQKFPNCGFLLMIDAEWYTKNVSELIKFCKEHENDICCSYQILLKNGGSDLYHVRLIRSISNVKFKGPVHEVIDAPFSKSVPEDIYFDYQPSSKGSEKTKQRWQRDLKLLLDYFKNNPKDSRTAFYIGQSYECLGILEQAFEWYKVRSELPGWDEENYETFYRLGRVVNSLSETNKNYTWLMAFDYYIKAFNLRPHRAEPLIRIAEHYWPDTPNKPDANIPLCFLFAKRALELPIPTNEKLWVDKYVYEYLRYDIASKSAWHVKEFEVGEQATLDAIKHVSPHLYHNLMCYKNSKK